MSGLDNKKKRKTKLSQAALRSRKRYQRQRAQHSGSSSEEFEIDGESVREYYERNISTSVQKAEVSRRGRLNQRWHASKAPSANESKLQKKASAKKNDDPIAFSLPKATVKAKQHPQQQKPEVQEPIYRLPTVDRGKQQADILSPELQDCYDKLKSFRGFCTEKYAQLHDSSAVTDLPQKIGWGREVGSWSDLLTESASKKQAVGVLEHLRLLNEGFRLAGRLQQSCQNINKASNTMPGGSTKEQSQAVFRFSMMDSAVCLSYCDAMYRLRHQASTDTRLRKAKTAFISTLDKQLFPVQQRLQKIILQQVQLSKMPAWKILAREEQRQAHQLAASPTLLKPPPNKVFTALNRLMASLRSGELPGIALYDLMTHAMNVCEAACADSPEPELTAALAAVLALEVQDKEGIVSLLHLQEIAQGYVERIQRFMPGGSASGDKPQFANMLPVSLVHCDEYFARTEASVLVNTLDQQYEEHRFVFGKAHGHSQGLLVALKALYQDQAIKKRKRFQVQKHLGEIYSHLKGLHQAREYAVARLSNRDKKDFAAIWGVKSPAYEKALVDYLSQRVSEVDPVLIAPQQSNEWLDDVVSLREELASVSENHWTNRELVLWQAKQLGLETILELFSHLAVCKLNEGTLKKLQGFADKVDSLEQMLVAEQSELKHGSSDEISESETSSSSANETSDSETSSSSANGTSDSETSSSSANGTSDSGVISSGVGRSDKSEREAGINGLSFYSRKLHKALAIFLGQGGYENISDCCNATRLAILQSEQGREIFHLMSKLYHGDLDVCPKNANNITAFHALQEEYGHLKKCRAIQGDDWDPRKLIAHAEKVQSFDGDCAEMCGVERVLRKQKARMELIKTIAECKEKAEPELFLRDFLLLSHAGSYRSKFTYLCKQVKSEQLQRCLITKFMQTEKQVDNTALTQTPVLSSQQKQMAPTLSSATFFLSSGSSSESEDSNSLSDSSTAISSSGSTTTTPDTELSEGEKEKIVNLVSTLKKR